MASPVINIRDTGRNSAKTGDVRGLSDNVVHSWTSGTTGTIAVTADATYDVTLTQPADTIIRNLIAIPAGNIVTAGASGDDVDFDLGTAAGGGQISRVHGPFVSEQEVEKVVMFLRAQGTPDYLDEVTEEEVDTTDPDLGATGSGDELYDRAIQLVLTERKASTSFVQRHLQIGYNRAARLIDKMEAEGVVSAANHVGKREILVGDTGVEC